MTFLLTLLTSLLLVGPALGQDMTYEEVLTQLQGCPSECRCPPNFPNAVYCDNKGLKHIPNIPPHTWYLYLQNNLIDVISKDALRNATQLRWLNLNRNKLTSKGVEEGVLADMPRLMHLFMDDNLLASVPSGLPSNLEQLRLSRNRISKIPTGVFSGMNRLTLLDLQGNKLQDDAVTEVSLKGLSSLVQINLAKNQLNSMPPGLPPSTAQIFLDGNNIEKIPEEYFKGLPKVAFLRLNRNKLGNSGLPKNVFNISSMLDLQLSHNQLTEVPLISSGLEHLHLDHNRIKSVNGSEICPVSAEVLEDYVNDGVPRLRYLRLDGNQIKPPIPRDVITCFRLLQSIVI
ncbi:keratocan [Hypomesus transpacificus]|uniref:keratocan n=1 Tax=Hypomesus transpacificus TaxID=137520 RepID=UPI001F07A306|nr:keratocan [Hypomesus transpacificus]XP_046878830.1 keratocan [Hypomesus transpacificus]XP_046878831.1 keratocan [Hypomesus transpacificus]XP_046878832.1 keratocan [Hypomesus transpacificus]